jgi:hypothetical protein
MNNELQTPLIEAAIAALRELGLVAVTEPALREHDDDVTITLRQDRKQFRYRTTVKRALRPGLIGAISLTLPGDREGRLLITDHATPPGADMLRRQGIQFVDAGGNAYLRRPGLLVFIAGRPPGNRRPVNKTLRVFRPTGLKTIFAMLSLPELAAAPQRDIALAAGVALGSVAHVFEGLRELGFLTEIRGTRHLLNRHRLTQQWIEAYARVLEATLEMSRFSASSANWWQHADIAKYGAQWGGETAAALLQQNLVPERAIVYAERTPARMLSQYRLKADSDGRVIMRRRFWHFDLPSPRHDIVPPLLVFADLAASGDARSLAAAEQIRDAYLD